MDNNQTKNRNKRTAEILKVKTNEDFNKQKPNPDDPNENKNHQEGADEESTKPQKTN